jgi:DNA gyrase subunit A
MTAQITEDRGSLVGALVVRPEDEVFAITSNGGVIRTRASEVRQTGRVTMGVRLMNLAAGNTVVALARNAESEAVDEPVDDEPADESVDEPVDEAVENSADESPEDDSGNE